MALYLSSSLKYIAPFVAGVGNKIYPSCDGKVTSLTQGLFFLGLWDILYMHLVSNVKYRYTLSYLGCDTLSPTV